MTRRVTKVLRDDPLSWRPVARTVPLTALQRTFALACAVHGDVVQAYVATFPGTGKWTRPVVRDKALELAAIPHVAEAIADAQRIRERAVVKALERYVISKESIIEELASIGYSNPGDYASWDQDGKVTFKPSDQLTRRQLASIVEIRANSNGTVVLKLASKMDALMNIARVAGLLGMEVRDKDEDDPDVAKERAAAREQLRALLDAMAVPEPLTIDGNAVRPGD